MQDAAFPHDHSPARKPVSSEAPFRWYEVVILSVLDSLDRCIAYMYSTPNPRTRAHFGTIYTSPEEQRGLPELPAMASVARLNVTVDRDANTVH
ncbi:MAG: hypothetical protein JWO56_1841 [Acidobacteria bacterium]|nr:hypothetical protein [Acidobacteriota bacterium]